MQAYIYRASYITFYVFSDYVIAEHITIGL